MPHLEQEIGSWDSVLLDNPSEDSFINNLHQRYKRDNIYVSFITFQFLHIHLSRIDNNFIYFSNFVFDLFLVVHRHIFGCPKSLQAVIHLYAWPGRNLCQQEPFSITTTHVSWYLLLSFLPYYYYTDIGANFAPLILILGWFLRLYFGNDI